MPDDSLRDHSCLATELFNLFIFRTGRSFDDKISAAKNQDWSQVVWDILETGVKKSFRRKNSGRPLHQRLAGDTAETFDGINFASATSSLSCTTASEIVGQYGARDIYGGNGDIPPESHDRERDSLEPEEGISVVLIETSERETEG
jgi:hypothetical protein